MLWLHLLWLHLLRLHLLWLHLLRLHLLWLCSLQARVAVNIVKQLQTSVLMLDEVDMILHPLKSELNWPLGKRKPLDYGASRWAVPFHLLDALFYCTPGRETPRVPERWKGNGTAQALLDRLHAAVQLGLERKVRKRTRRTSSCYTYYGDTTLCGDARCGRSCSARRTSSCCRAPSSWHNSSRCSAAGCCCGCASRACASSRMSRCHSKYSYSSLSIAIVSSELKDE